MNVGDLSGKTVAVTGAGSGIGRETALAFARRGADLEIGDLNEETVEATAEAIRKIDRGGVTAARVDVADAAQVRSWADAVHARIPALDILVNNAGVAIGGGFLDTTLEDWDWILGVNTKGVVHGCHAFAPAMVARGAGGHIVNVASMAGIVATDTLAAYCTTKFSIVGLSEALREELAPHGIGVSCICPGLINTPITRAAKLVGPLSGEENRAELVRTYEKRNYGPERVALAILRAIERNRAVTPVTPEAWMLYYLKRFSPGLVSWLSRRMGEASRRRLGIDR